MCIVAKRSFAANSSVTNGHDETDRHLIWKLIKHIRTQRVRKTNEVHKRVNKRERDESDAKIADAEHQVHTSDQKKNEKKIE